MTEKSAKAIPAGKQAEEKALPQKPKKLAVAKNTICLWYDKDAEAAAHFYAETFPDSAVSAVHRAPSDYPGGKKGDVLTVEFTVAGVACIGINGGTAFEHSEARSLTSESTSTKRTKLSASSANTGESVSVSDRLNAV